MKHHLIDVRTHWRTCLVTLFIGFAGAFLFAWAKLPLPWVTGPLFVTTILALSGFQLWMPLWLRPPSLAVLGVLFGSTISPDFVDQVIFWFPSMCAVLVFVLVTIPFGTTYLIFVGKYDFVTSLLSAAPGGLIPMTLLGQSYNADDRVITVVQTFRLVLTILIIPLAFQLFGGYVPSGNIGTGGSFAAYLPGDILPTALACVLGYFLAVIARLPAPSLMGPIIVIAFLRFNGWIESEIPDSLVAVSQVFIGISIALPFNGTRVRKIFVDIVHASASSLIAISFSVLFALITAQFVSSSAEALILAFAPGGFAEMALIGFGLGLEISFVISHQILRFFLIVLGIPIVMMIAKGRPDKKNVDNFQ